MTEKGLVQTFPADNLNVAAPGMSDKHTDFDSVPNIMHRNRSGNT